MALAEGVEILPLLAKWERGLMPLKEAEPLDGPPGPLSTSIGDHLAMLLTKVSPGISTEQADAWIKVVVVALSDLPGRVSRDAAAAAIHRPLRFANEIEATIRQIAAGLMAQHALACARLREMAVEQDRQRRGANDDPGPITNEAIRHMPAAYRSLGLRLGHLTQAQVDAALAEDVENKS